MSNRMGKTIHGIPMWVVLIACLAATAGFIEGFALRSSVKIVVERSENVNTLCDAYDSWHEKTQQTSPGMEKICQSYMVSQ